MAGDEERMKEMAGDEERVEGVSGVEEHMEETVGVEERRGETAGTKERRGTDDSRGVGTMVGGRWRRNRGWQRAYKQGIEADGEENLDMDTMAAEGRQFSWGPASRSGLIDEH